MPRDLLGIGFLGIGNWKIKKLKGQTNFIYFKTNHSFMLKLIFASHHLNSLKLAIFHCNKLIVHFHVGKYREI